MQHNVLQEMLRRVAVGNRVYICPPPPSVMSPTLDNFTLPAKCAGCGHGYNVNEAVMLAVLPYVQAHVSLSVLCNHVCLYGSMHGPVLLYGDPTRCSVDCVMGRW